MSLMSRLSEIMPKKSESLFAGKLRIKQYPIRHSADAFLGWLGDDLPKTREEVHASLWVFGEMLCGDMEKQVNHSMKLVEDVISKHVNPIYVIKKEKNETSITSY